MDDVGYFTKSSFLNLLGLDVTCPYVLTAFSFDSLCGVVKKRVKNEHLITRS